MPALESPMPTATEVLRRAQAAYDAVETLEQHAKGSVEGSSDYLIALVSFSRPGRLRVRGKAPGDTDDDLELVSDGNSTWVYCAEEWEEVEDVESGIGAITGISLGAGTLVPATLFHTLWGSLGHLEGKDLPVALEKIRGRSSYRIEATDPFPMKVWVDAHTYFFCREEMTSGGYTFNVEFDLPKVDRPIPDSYFQVPR